MALHVSESELRKPDFQKNAEVECGHSMPEDK